MRAGSKGKYVYRFAVSVQSIKDGKFVYLPGEWIQRSAAASYARNWAVDQGHAKDAASVVMRITRYRVYK